MVTSPRARKRYGSRCRVLQHPRQSIHGGAFLYTASLAGIRTAHVGRPLPTVRAFGICENRNEQAVVSAVLHSRMAPLTQHPCQSGGSCGSQRLGGYGPSCSWHAARLLDQYLRRLTSRADRRCGCAQRRARPSPSNPAAGTASSASALECSGIRAAATDVCPKRGGHPGMHICYRQFHLNRGVAA